MQEVYLLPLTPLMYSMVVELRPIPPERVMQALLQLMPLRGRGRLHLMGQVVGHSAKFEMMERAMQGL